MSLNDAELKTLLTETRTIACVGVSANPVRPSHFVARYLAARGYEVTAVNPGLAGQTMFGRAVQPDLASLEGRIDMLDIFRRSEHVPALVDEALETLPGLRVIWMQIGVRHEAAAHRARERGITVVQDRCPKIEYQRLFGELRRGGFATGIISSSL
ncbi:CoA-binding protein [Profundibacterium mesophilum]|uniref:O-acetylhomoserine -lyase n=1 Tax=Profundibacterium mesophilum KAUST100406-0324 TaxID=1037889 RepID=A0A921NT73_9RHOB|nr:CoA-binding protein [Profundibacterium mesophilum]KAF0677600.1 O-acetylhomoserine -lyase [Profundibacterium mesophilum KAUST100406-0324]